MNKVNLILISLLLVFNTSIEARQVKVEDLAFDLGVVSRNIANYKSCIVSLDDDEEEDMAIFYSQELIKKLQMLKKLSSDDRAYTTQTARLHAMELDKVPFQKMKIMCHSVYDMTVKIKQS